MVNQHCLPEGAPSDMPYIIIEDERIIRQCKTLHKFRKERYGRISEPHEPPLLPLHRRKRYAASVMQEWIRLLQTRPPELP